MGKEQFINPQRKINRRNFMSTATAGTALAVAYASGTFRPESVQAEQNAPLQSSPEANQVKQEEKHHNSTANDVSAALIAGYFGGLVGLAAAGKIGFGPKTALLSMGMEGARLAALKGSGDNEAFNHDKKELTGGYSLLPVLVTFAETASHFRVDNDGIFKPERVERLFHEVTDQNELPEEPQTHDNLEEWQSFLEVRKSELIKVVSENAAVTTVLAPLGTTYTSASVARESFKRVRGILNDIHFADKVVSTLKPDVNADTPSTKVIYGDQIEEWKQQAFNQSIDDINGIGGYLQLNIALSSNLSGAWLAGDPPNFYFIQRHPDLALKANAAGLVMSELASAAMNYSWLKSKLGWIDPKKFITEYVHNQYKTLNKLKTSFTDQDLRDVSFNGGRQNAHRLFDQIKRYQDSHPNTEVLGRIKVDQIPTFAFFLDPKTLISQKIEVVTQMTKDAAAKVKGGKSKNHLIDEDYKGRFDFEDFLGFIESSKIQEILEQQNPGSLNTLAGDLRKVRLDQTTSDATALIEEITNPAGDEEPKPFIEQLLEIPLLSASLSTSEISKKLKNVADQTREMHQLRSFRYELDTLANTYQRRKKTRGRGMDRLMKDWDARKDEIDPEKHLQIADQIRVIGEKRQRGFHTTDIIADLKSLAEEIGNAAEPEQNEMEDLYRLLGALGPDDLRKPFEDAVLLTRNNRETEHHEKKLLEHQAQEVLFVLGTQLPVVPGLIHGVNRILPKLAGVGENGPDLPQLKAMSAAVLGFEAVTSAFADNVAAYLFAEGVLDDLMGNFYGEEYAGKKDLKDSVALSALFMAIAAGSLTKIGNGPTVTMAELDMDGEFKDINFGKSMLNPYSVLQTLLLLGASYKFISDNLTGNTQE